LQRLPTVLTSAPITRGRIRLCLASHQTKLAMGFIAIAHSESDFAMYVSCVPSVRPCTNSTITYSHDLDRLPTMSCRRIRPAADVFTPQYGVRALTKICSALTPFTVNPKFPQLSHLHRRFLFSYAQILWPSCTSLVCHVRILQYLH
jgi:hypothetical protein